MKDIKEYFDNDPELKKLMEKAQKGKLSATWQQKLYEEIFHQMMIFDNIIDLDKCKKIIKDGLKDK